MSKSNLRLTLEAVEANPQHWDQRMWHCGTSHCFAGFAEALRLGRPLTCPVTETLRYRTAHIPEWAGSANDADLIDQDATMAWLGVSDDENEYGDSDWGFLTDPDNTLDDLRRIVAELEAKAQ